MARAMPNLNPLNIMSGYNISSKKLRYYQSNAEQFLGKFPSLNKADLMKRSPLTIPEDPHTQFAVAVENLFEPDDTVELKVAQFVSRQTKAVPGPANYRRSASEWAQIAHARSLDALLGENCGVFMRINPVDGTRPGSGAYGATKDSDIVRFERVLIEHDCLPQEIQIALLSTLALPISAIIESGGSSVHALIKVGAQDYDSYVQETEGLRDLLRDYFGFDPTTINPSRLTRAPGFSRQERDRGHTRQRLLYLNPNPEFAPINQK